MKASILINNYNYGRYLRHCLRSAFAQTHADCEVILYDDGSTDDSASVYATFPGLRAIARPNYGKYPSYNQANAIHRAFEVSSGDVICLLDADDAFLPTKVARVVAAFSRRPDLAVVQHRMFEIDDHDRRTGDVRSNILCGVDVRHAIYATGALEYFFMQTSGLAFRRSVLARLLPLDDTRYPLIWPDVRLTRAAIFLGGVETIYEPLGEYRVHAAGDSNKLRDPAFYREVVQQHYLYFADVARVHGAPPLPALGDSERKRKVLTYALRHGDHRLAFLARAIQRFARKRVASRAMNN